MEKKFNGVDHFYDVIDRWKTAFKIDGARSPHRIIRTFQYSCKEYYESGDFLLRDYLNPALPRQFRDDGKSLFLLVRGAKGSIVRITPDKGPRDGIFASRFPRQHDYPGRLEEVIPRYRSNITRMDVPLSSLTGQTISFSFIEPMFLSISQFTNSAMLASKIQLFRWKETFIESFRFSIVRLCYAYT